MLALVGLAPRYGFALHRDTPFLLPITTFPGGTSQHPFATRAEPQFIVFDSADDLLGTGSVGRQIFMYDLRPEGRVLKQITSFRGDSANATVSRNHDWIVFDSEADILANGSQAKQIFALNRSNGTFVQLTAGSADSTNPYLDFNGHVVAFQSRADLLARDLTAPGSQIYWTALNGSCPLPAPCSIIRQVTNAPGESVNPVFSDDGSVIFFQSNAPLLGPSNGSFQIYGYTRATGDLFQLTAGAGDSTNPRTDKTGRVVVFQSTADLLSNGSVGRQVFMLDRLYGALKQLTFGPGESFSASLGFNDQYVIFASTADLLHTGSSGQHLFLYDPVKELMFQLTAKLSGLSDHPQANGNTIFPFETTEDPTDSGVTGRQIVVINVFGVVPTQSLGVQTFRVLPGDSQNGSQAHLTTRYGTAVAGLTSGSIDLSIGTPNFDGQASVDAAQNKIDLPAIRVPSFGAICLRATGPGQGSLDCKGHLAGGTLDLTQDHDISDIDPGCKVGCLESATCAQGSFSHVHPTVCNGPIVVNSLGTYRRGALQLSVPVTADLSVGPGLDRTYCTDDDDYRIRGAFSASLFLSTDTESATITDADAAAGARLSVSDIGAPFDCKLLQLKDLFGAQLVGLLPMLDFTGVVPGLPGAADVVVGLRLAAGSGAPCTLGSCAPHSCLTDSDCTDGNVCNGTARCVSGVCVPGTALSCDDGNVCNGVETCDPIAGCQPGTPPDCADHDPCTIDFCDPISGCGHSSVGVCCKVDSDCDDRNACTGREICVSERCETVPGTALQCQADGNPCTVESCDPVAGCTSRVLPDGTPCNDGNVCNGSAICQSGRCQPGTPLNCDDGARCTADTCDPSRGCIHTAIPNCCSADADCDDRNVCNGVEVCRSATCFPGTPLICDDGDVCNGIESCDPLTGCKAGTPLNCNDGARCTTDSCDRLLGCLHVAVQNCCTLDSDCVDNNLCNGTERCDTATGNCVPGIPLVCSDGNVCNGTEICEPSRGCIAGTPRNCDDANVCTTDTCDPIAGCQHTPLAACCTKDADCDDHNACNGHEKCALGTCIPGLPLACADDGNPCTADSCDPAHGCVHTPLPDGTLCADANLCNGTEICRSGACVAGTPTNCDDGVRCTKDTCDPATGCHHTFIPNCCHVNADCDDRNACNGVELCVVGACVTGTPLVCNDTNPCNGTETCDPVSGCRPGTPLNCNDNLTCTTDTCDPTAGCVHTSVHGCCHTDADCNDGNVCNGVERCFAGDCVSGTALQCRDGNACNGVETCDPVAGCRPGSITDFVAVGCDLFALKEAIGRLPRKVGAAQGELERLINAAIRNVRLATTPPGLRSRNLLLGAQRKVRRARHLMVRVMKRGNLGADVGGPLVDLMADASDRLFRLATNPTGAGASAVAESVQE